MSKKRSRTEGLAAEGMGFVRVDFRNVCVSLQLRRKSSNAKHFDASVR